jgi:hypothetical protein
VRRRGLERREPLGRHRRRVLLGGEPLARVGGLRLVADDRLARGVVAVDLLEELVDELLVGTFFKGSPLE